MPQRSAARLVALAVLLFVLVAGAAESWARTPAVSPGQGEGSGVPEDAGYLDYQLPAAASGFNPTTAVLRLLLGLALVLVLLFVSGRFLGQRLGLPRGTGRHLAVLDLLPLGPGKGIFLVRVGKRQLVIGVSGDRITVLRELEEGDLTAEPLPLEASFPATLNGAVQKNSWPQPSNLWQEAANAIRREVERLRGGRQG